jgi:AraC family transcriptional regulator
MRTEIERVVVGLREHYAENLTLTDLGEMASFSPFHMARLFSDETGLPPGSFLTAVRMEAARSKLLRTDASVTDICFQVGYSSLGAFSNRFTTTVGLSPGKYRRLTELGGDTVDLMACDRDHPVAYGGLRLHVIRDDGWCDEPVYVAAFPSDSRNRRQARCLRMRGAREVQLLSYVPTGRWRVRAVSVGPKGRLGSMVSDVSEPLCIGIGQTRDVVLRLRPGRRPDRNELRLEQGELLPDLFRY